MPENGETERARERRLIREAEDRARATARIEAKLEAQDKQIALNVQKIGEIRGEITGLAAKLNDLYTAFTTATRISDDRADQAAKAAAKAESAYSRQVTKRELYVSAFGVTAAILSALGFGGVFH